MAVDIETATLEDYRDMMLRPTKLNETAQVLYDLAQQAKGSLIQIGTSKQEIEALTNRVSTNETNINGLTNNLNQALSNIASLSNAVETLGNAVNSLYQANEAINSWLANIEQRVTALENV